MIEIRWHGRGGQGAKTAALLLAEVAFKIGKYAQGFPEYGPERMGAPITAYDRISDTPIRVHSNIYEPDFVVVVDESLIDTNDVTAGLKADGAIIVNTQRSRDEIVAQMAAKGYTGRVYTIDAREVSIKTLGRYFPNSPMLAAIVKVSGFIEEQVFLDNMLASFKHKFARKPEVVDGNMEALKLALKEVKG